MKPPRARPALPILVFITVIAMLLTPSRVSANATPPRMPAEGGGVVVPGSTSAVRIEREMLSFDYTQDVRNPQVKATYELANVSGGDLSLDLLFVAPSLESLKISMDGRALAIQDAPNVQLPAEWTASNQGLDPRTGDEYQLLNETPGFRRAHAWSFKLELPAGGRGILQAEYEAVTGYDRDRADHMVRHLVYVLGPARNWAGFGTLEVSVALPSHYQMASSPPMKKLDEKQGISHYGATFDGVPSELLRVSSVATHGSLAEWAPAAELAIPFLCAILVGVLCGWLFAHVKRQLLAVLGAMAGAFVGSIVLMVMVTGEVTGRLDPAFDDRSHAGGMGDVLLLILAVMTASLLSLTIAGLWAGIGSRRRTDAGRPAPPSHR